MNKPLVSVVMSVFNGQEFLNIAIDSILLQTYKNLELIVIDDGSTDGTRHIVENYHDHRIKYYRQRNLGQPAALNSGIKKSNGKYIARMDADDISYADRLAKQVRYLEDDDSLSMVGTSFDIIDMDSGIVGSSYHLDKDEDIRAEFLVRNPFGHGTVMVRKNVLDKVGGYDTKEPIEDYELWWRIAKKHKVANIPEMLYGWRNVPTGISSGKSAQRQGPITRLMKLIWEESEVPQLTTSSFIKTLNHYMELGPKYREQYLYMLCAIVICLNKTGNRSAALKLLTRLMRVRGTAKAFLDLHKDAFSHNYNVGIVDKF